MEWPAYRCFLPDLTGFTGFPLRRTRPSTPRHGRQGPSRNGPSGGGFSPAIADCGYRAPLTPRLARWRSGFGTPGREENLNVAALLRGSPPSGREDSAWAGSVEASRGRRGGATRTARWHFRWPFADDSRVQGARGGRSSAPGSPPHGALSGPRRAHVVRGRRGAMAGRQSACPAGGGREPQRTPLAGRPSHRRHERLLPGGLGRCGRALARPRRGRACRGRARTRRG